MRNLGDVLRDEMLMRDRILSILKHEPKTIPEIAEILKKPNREVMLWTMAMWRYGAIVETGKADEDGYYRYRPRK
jgi:hypothetical protein